MSFVSFSFTIILDIKPSNILSGKRGNPSSAKYKLADFGLVEQNKQLINTLRKSKTKVGSGTVGTACYMAPELFDNPFTDAEAVEASRRTDMFSFGSIVYVE